ncbi:MAG TPA: hypothetical protein VMI55_02595 [Thermoplasmata archaeon]|nr:hypothetical protein [Thermoplasmata archaeon]
MTSAQSPGSGAVVVAGDEETRILFRGLLRLHHIRVDGEADGAERALRLVRDHRPHLLVADMNLAEGSTTTLLAEARQIHPEVRVVLVASASRPPPQPSDGKPPDAVLLRPFRIREFAEAVNPGAFDGGGPAT